MNNDQCIWKYRPSALYRENNIVYLDKLDISLLNNYYHMKYKIRKRHNFSLQNSFEKLPELEKTRQKFKYELPKLEYPQPLKLMTVEEYRVILERRIKEEEQKYKWELPKIEVYVKPSKYSIKSIVDNEKLRIKMEQFLID